MADIEIRTSGATSGLTVRVPDARAKITQGNGLIDYSYSADGVCIQFSITRGKGRSRMLAWIKPGGFQDLAEKMIAASPKEARQAFLSALAIRAD